MNFFEFWNQYKWRIISVLFAIVFAAFLFTIGFWKTLLLFVLVGIAFFIGTLCLQARTAAAFTCAEKPPVKWR